VHTPFLHCRMIVRWCWCPAPSCKSDLQGPPSPHIHARLCLCGFRFTPLLLLVLVAGSGVLPCPFLQVPLPLPSQLAPLTHTSYLHLHPLLIHLQTPLSLPTNKQLTLVYCPEHLTDFSTFCVDNTRVCRCDGVAPLTFTASTRIHILESFKGNNLGILRHRS
jgi:hypothetical protein